MKQLIIFSGALLLSLVSFSQESYYRVYQYETPLKGHLEVTAWTTYIAKSNLAYPHYDKVLSRDGLVAHAIEAEYGIGDRFVLAGYADFEDPAGDHLNFIRNRIEARYRFGQRYDNFINTAAYFEVYLPDKKYSTAHELEARLIIDKDFEDIRVALNPVFSKYIDGDEDHALKYGLNAGIYYRRGKVFQPGVEYYENFSEHTLSVFPALNINIGGSVVWNLGAGFGTTKRNDDFTLKSVLQIDLQAIRPSKLMRKKW